MVYGNLEQCWLHLLGKGWAVLMKLFSVHEWSSVCCEGHKWNSVMEVIRFETSETICWVILCLNVMKTIHIIYWLIWRCRGWNPHDEPPFSFTFCTVFTPAAGATKDQRHSSITVKRVSQNASRLDWWHQSERQSFEIKYEFKKEEREGEVSV